MALSDYEARIPALPAPLDHVPDDRAGWLAWRSAVLTYRELVRRRADADPEFRARVNHLAAVDPAYDMIVYGCIFEPRRMRDIELLPDGTERTFIKPAGWYPWIPFHFQVQMIRWIEDVISRDDDETGKSDGICEKSREMGASWIFCQVAAHQWRWLDNISIGIASRKEELVDKPEDPKSLFFKIRALLGLNPRIPEKVNAPGTFYHDLICAPPPWLVPHGFKPDEHDFRMNLIHPTKSNSIKGESTTSQSFIGDRLSWALVDEGAKIKNKLKEVYGGLQAVTIHRFINSSADLRYGPDFHELAQAAKYADENPGATGPSYCRLDWWLHPLRTEAWFRAEKARATDPHDFAREYEINYRAGFGDWVYPYAQQMEAGHYPYDPVLGDVVVAIDPGIRDPNAVLLFQYDPFRSRWRLFDALAFKAQSADEVAPILMGLPPGHWARESLADQNQIELADTFCEVWDSQEPDFVGDPYGDNAGGASSDSFYERLFTRADEIQEKDRASGRDVIAHDLAVATKYDEGARFHPARKEALAQLLQILDINDTPRCQYVLAAFKEARYKPADDESQVMTEPAKPVHDWTSHPRSAAEYFAVHAIAATGLAGMTARAGKAAKRTHRQPPRRNAA